MTREIAGRETTVDESGQVLFDKEHKKAVTEIMRKKGLIRENEIVTSMRFAHECHGTWLRRNGRLVVNVMLVK